MHKWLSADVDVVVDAIGNRVEVECTLLAPGGLSQVRWQQGHGFLSVIREGRRWQHWLIGGGMKIGSGSWPCKADRQAVFCRTAGGRVDARGTKAFLLSLCTSYKEYLFCTVIKE